MRVLSIIGILIIGQPSVAQDDTVYVTTPQTFSLCYDDGMDSSVAYITTTIYSLALKFCSGEMEICCDEVWVYDGGDNTAPLLYVGNGDQGDLAGIFVISTGPALYLEIRSDDTVSCATGQFEPLTWVVDTFWYGVSDCQFLGLEEDQGERPIIAPNPADEVFSMSPLDRTSTTYFLHDVSGRTVNVQAAWKDRGLTFITRDLRNGTYFIKLRTPSRTETYPVLVVH